VLGNHGSPDMNLALRLLIYSGQPTPERPDRFRPHRIKDLHARDGTDRQVQRVHIDEAGLQRYVTSATY